MLASRAQCVLSLVHGKWLASGFKHSVLSMCGVDDTRHELQGLRTAFRCQSVLIPLACSLLLLRWCQVVGLDFAADMLKDASQRQRSSQSALPAGRRVPME